MADSFESGDDRMLLEAEELMRQRRFHDAARRYQDLHRRQPTDLWMALGFASALECAGEVDAAERVLEDATTHHGRSAPLHRFRQMFFTRREDFRRAQASQVQLRGGTVDADDADHLADLYFNQGRYHEALSELERQLAAGIDDPAVRATVLARSGACLRQRGDADAARERLLMAQALAPGEAWTLSELAESERALGLADQARTHYREALERNPDDHWTRGHLAQIESEQGRTDEAIALYEEVVRREPRAVWARVELAQVLSERDPERATQLCRAALAQDPDYPWAHAQLGSLARRKNQLEESYACYLRAAKASGGAPWIQHELCDVARALGRPEVAEKHLEQARAADPYDATTHGYLADLRRHQGRFAEARSHLEQAVQLDEGYLWAWRELAEVRAVLGDHKAAEEAYRHAREIAPDEAITDGLMAFLLRHRGEHPRAEPWLERAVERQADYLWAWRELIELHLHHDRPLQAVQVADRALAALPDTSVLLGLAAEARRRLGRFDEAHALCERAVAAAPEVAHLQALRAEIAIARDRADEAIAAAARAATLDRGPEFQLLHAQVLAAANHDAEAWVIVERLLAAAQPSASACELAAALCERRGDRAQALRLLDRALTIAGGDQHRLRIRRARLAVQEGDHAAAEPLVALVEYRGDLPWGELAQVLAQAGHAAAARRAVQRHAASVGPAQAWIAVAEVEFHLGNREAAWIAAESAVTADPAHPAPRLVAAVVAEHRGDNERALEHLGHAVQGLKHPDAGMLRQIAQLEERLGRTEDAERRWRSLGPSAQADLACFLYRSDRVDDAEAAAAPVLAGPDGPEVHRLMRDRALAHLRRSGPAEALRRLLEHDARLGLVHLLIAAQLALASGDVAAARHHLQRCAPANDQERRAVLMLEARVLLGHGRVDDAVTAARQALAISPRDGEVRHVLAEGLVLQRRLADAIAVLLDGGPCDHAGAALAAALLLEREGERAAVVQLSRWPCQGSSLGRLLLAAFPQAAQPDSEAADAEDAGHVPVAHVVGGALARQLAVAGRHDLAAVLLDTAALTAARIDDHGLVARLRRQRLRPLRRAQGLRAALTEAWRCRDLPGFLRILLP